MAKNPKASPDPAALAFSAVEDALKDSVFNLDDNSEDLPPLELPDDEEERRRAGEKLAAHTASVANDDRRGGARGPAVIPRASARPVLIAAALAVIWLAAVLGTEYLRYRTLAAGTSIFSSGIDFISFLALLFLPPAGFFAIATLMRRSQDLRLAATSISQAAIRLSEPETTATD
jgi:hypothetical protein